MIFRQAWKWAGIAALAFPVLYVASCSFNGFAIQSAFESVADGSSEAALTAAMGRPSEFDSDGTLNSIYADRPCTFVDFRRTARGS